MAPWSRAMRRYTRGMPCEWGSRGRSIPTRRTRFTRCVMRGFVIMRLLNVGVYAQRPTYCKPTPISDPSPLAWLRILRNGALNRVNARAPAGRKTSLMGCECRTILYANLGPGHHLDCANFCAHPTDRWAHLRTASHMLRSRLSCFVSVETLKTGRLFSVGLLPWAQEAWSSNLHAPTNSTNRI